MTVFSAAARKIGIQQQRPTFWLHTIHCRHRKRSATTSSAGNVSPAPGTPAPSRCTRRVTQSASCVAGSAGPKR